MQILEPTILDPTALLQRIRALVADDLTAIDRLMQEELSSSVPLTREITQHIFKNKGKQLRPLLMALTAHAVTNRNTLEKKHYELAIVIEFVHTATLLHDDVVDHSELRRGQHTANVTWGNAASVLVGDFLYSRAFQILARHTYPDIMRILSETTNAIAEGEVLQLMNQHDAELTEENYFHVITQKTAQLFSAASEIGALLEHAPIEIQKAMAHYGLQLGIIFQIIDDLLDYEISSDITGKNRGDDLNEGKATLPLIYAMQHTIPEKADIIRNAVKNNSAHQLDVIVKILHETDALIMARKKAEEKAQLALHALTAIPNSVYRRALEELVVFAAQRNY